MNTLSTSADTDQTANAELTRAQVIRLAQDWRPEHGSRDQITALMQQHKITGDTLKVGF